MITRRYLLGLVTTSLAAGLCLPLAAQQARLTTVTLTIEGMT